tara:strand:+ start:7125 stop:8912 length:1788 start_codon:yes stop_codon:yes gene_type:complete
MTTMFLPLLLTLTGSTVLTTTAPASPVPALAPFQDEAAIRDLIARGQAMLREGKAKDAEVLFAEADAKNGGKQLGTYVWVLRSWVAQGRYNDAFNEVDTFAKASGSPIEVHYIHGIGSFARALDNQAAGGNSTLQLAWLDTVTKLNRVLDEDPERFGDAWRPLAQAAIEGNDAAHLEIALRASEQAVTLEPDSGAALEVRGRAHFWNYRELSDAEKEAEAKRALDEALAAWTLGIAKTSAEKANANQLANLHLRAAVGLRWRGDNAAAAVHYSEAIGWWPSPPLVDYSDLWSMLTLAEGDAPIQPYIDCLLAGKALFEERWGASDPADATMLWWLGYAYFSAQRYDESEATFLSSVGKVPTFTNNYWYAGLCRYYGEDYEGACAHWRMQFEANPDDIKKSVTSEPKAQNVAIIAFAQGKRAALGERSYPGRRDAVTMGEVLVLAEPDNFQRWNDLGLFCRDAGAAMPDTVKGAARLQGNLYLRAFEAYVVAMRLAPSKPHLYNDAAVILHYYLEKDYALAKELYGKSLEMATAQIDSGGLEDEDLALARIAKRDAANNLAALEKKVAEAGDNDEDEGESGDDDEGEGDAGGDGGI